MKYASLLLPALVVASSALADGYSLPDNGPSKPELAPGMIDSWRVSDAFEEAEIVNVPDLDERDIAARTWTALDAEPSGIINLARLQAIVDDRNTVFARYDIRSDRAGFKQLNFGYSDIARVYPNGKLIYSGDNTYMSRDYRYLGTIGLFDSVLLRLEPGHNDLRIAVTEAFGGWGIMARLGDFGDTR